ncbi:hypothetical protein FGL97_09030 [Pseudomonas putida]|uniref:hypothetical protein n=1 Tax=Pseudomonas putida TaxID=303 RepID=UPI00159CF8BC|nr:hypothetical protein [Pseudomonas putida]NVN63366.1 hypothetical protein [Pseudomonas putida]NVN68359.1 hypothetical protein [Pseudomonas putida]
MALSAFGDEIPDAPSPGPAAPKPPAPQAPQASAFGDPLSAFGDPLDADEAQVKPVPSAAPSQPWNANDLLPESLRPIGRAIDDFGLSLSKGIIGAAEGVTGLGDIATGGRVSPSLAHQFGYDPAGRRAELDRMATPEHQQAMQQLDRAQGFGGTLQALRDNPALIGHAITESLPSMALGGVAGRGVALGAKALGASGGLAGLLGAASGEGLMSAGQQASQITQQTGGLTPGQTALAVGTGAATGILGAAGAKVGKALGIGDVDAMLAGQNGGAIARNLVQRVLGGTTLESLEEAGQSTSEQVLGNIALGKDPFDGVAKAATMGGITGGAMGGGANLLARPNAAQAQQPPAQAPQVDPRIAAARQAVPDAIRNYLYPEQQATPAPAPAAPQPAPQPVAFAGSRNVRPLFESMGMDQQQMDSSLALLADDEPNIEAARRGVVGWEETGRLAALTGTTVEKLRKHRLGVAFNAEEQVAATRLLREQTTKTLDLGQKISSGNATEIEQANFLQSLNDLRTTQKAVMASRAEIGRALSVMRADVTTMKQAGHLLDGVGGAQGAKAIADALTNAARVGGVEAANKLARQAGSDGFWTAYKSLLLSSPDTHFVNVISNLATSLMQVPTRAVAGGIGAAKRLVGLNGETRIGESVYQLGGMIEGAVNGAKGAVSSWRTGEDAFGGENKAEVYRTDYPGQQVWGVPLRLLQSEDQFFKYLNDGMARYAGAYRMAASELKGQGPKAVHQRVREILADPPKELVEAGEDAALFHTFNNRAGKITQAVNNLRHSLPYGTGNIVVPFLKTPANLITYAVKHSPAAWIFKQVRQDLASGGHAQEEALARMGIGSLLMSFGALGLMSGNLTGGGPEDPDARKAWLAAGNQPYSLKINGQWHQYSRIEPMATLVGIAADIASGRESQEFGFASLIKAVGRNFTSKTWLLGLSGVMQAMTDPDRYGGSWVNRTAATLAQPATILSHVGRYMDQYQRETDRDSFTDQLAYRLPGLRESLPIKRDQFGAALMEPQRQIGRAGPIPSTVPSDDPVRRESARLGWTPGKQQDHFTSGKVKHTLTAEQVYERDQVTGQLIHRDATVLMRSKAWQNMDDDQRREALDKVVKRARNAVKVALIPWLTAGKRGPLDRLKSSLKPEVTKR